MTNETDRELLKRLQREGRFDPNTDDEFDAIRDLSDGDYHSSIYPRRYAR